VDDFLCGVAFVAMLIAPSLLAWRIQDEPVKKKVRH